MADARFVRLEGIESPCLLVTSDGSIPEELVVDLPENPADLTAVSGAGAGSDSDVSTRRSVVFRLQPTTLRDLYPAYVEVFDE